MKGAKRKGHTDEFLLSLARKRVKLPDVAMKFDYQDDVDTLCIRFSEPLDPGPIADDFEEGVIALYEGDRIVGVEIIDITSQMDSKLNALSRRLRDEEFVR